MSRVRNALYAAAVGFSLGMMGWIAVGLLVMVAGHVPLVWGIAAGVAVAILLAFIEVATHTDA